MPWSQVYDPLGSTFLSTLLASAPIVVLLGLLLAGLSAPRAALAGLLTALLTAITGFGMPTAQALAAAGYGALFGLLPIGWIVVNAVFLFHLTLRAGQFEVVKRSVAALSPDQRMQALLIAFSFGAFIEGAAGFGTPVAISAALLIGLGFKPLEAAGLALIANTSPVAFGALGTPIITLAKMVEADGGATLNEYTLSAMAGRQLPIFSLIVPAWLVWVMSGWRGVIGCWPAILVCGGSFAFLQFIMANYHGPTLVDVVGGLGSLVSLAVFLRFWQPKETMSAAATVSDEPNAPPLTRGAVAYAWTPWLLLSLCVFVWGLPTVKSALRSATSPSFAVPALHQQVVRTPPVVANPAPEKAIYEFDWLASTGAGIFFAALLSGAWLRLPPGVIAFEFFDTVWKMRYALATIACMLALAFVTKFSGSDATLGLAFTYTGPAYPFFAPLLGWLGVALTGSDTSSNALFGGLQKITAEQLGLNPLLIVASNSTGGVMGKMIDAQSIVVAAVATRQVGQEGAILRYVLPHSIAMAALMGLLTLLQAYVWPFSAMVP